MITSDQGVYLFGGADRPWNESDWVASDDRVRGGKSQSYMECSSDSTVASFHGHLDITALGGAGFASQRSKDPHTWDLSNCQGLCVKVNDSDGKKYTLILKDEVLPRRADGREQSSVSWEFDFVTQETRLFIPWKDLKPTYRGRPLPDAKPLDLRKISRVSIMMRSFFGQQEGCFRLELQYIAAIKSKNESKLSPPLTIAESSTSHSSLKYEK
ncbi:CIA30-domain-containing protein [Whalleya microplaca]|nr:CIA30-domain-containing protein [Whalleya microplaca]